MSGRISSISLTISRPKRFQSIKCRFHKLLRSFEFCRPMNALDAMHNEIEYQAQSLQKQEMQRRDRNCLFIGSGDSYVAGLVAQHVSGCRALCCYPIDVIQNPSIVLGRNTYIVSISGNTKANRIAAKIAESRLAYNCDNVKNR